MRFMRRYLTSLLFIGFVVNSVSAASFSLAPSFLECVRSLVKLGSKKFEMPGLLPRGEDESAWLSEGSLELLEAKKSFLEFNRLSRQLWVSKRSEFLDELTNFKGLNRANRKTKIAEVSGLLSEALFNRAGSRGYGVHYNMHGGLGHEYIERGGILATYGNALYTQASVFSAPVSKEMRDLMTQKRPSVFFYQNSFPSFLSRSLARETYVILFDIEKVEEHPQAVYGGGYAPAFVFDQSASASFSGISFLDFLAPPFQVTPSLERALHLDQKLSAQERHFLRLLHFKELLSLWFETH